jgi:hypothetical protein
VRGLLFRALWVGIQVHSGAAALFIEKDRKACIAKEHYHCSQKEAHEIFGIYGLQAMLFSVATLIFCITIASNLAAGFMAGIGIDHLLA